jgi:adenosine/AMP kinase
MQLITVKIEKLDDTNFILGQTHFIKSVEDIHEALVGAVPGIEFGLASCEASGKCLVRHRHGHDRVGQEKRHHHRCRTQLHRLPGRRLLPAERVEYVEVCAGSVLHLLRNRQPHEGRPGRDRPEAGILGVVDGFSPTGVEDEGEIKWRKDFLRNVGYKLC